MNSKEKISSQEIVDLVASKASVSKRAAEEFLKMMITTIEDALLAGESVKVKGFGTFKLQWNEPRKSVNVQTGEDIIIEGYYKVGFVPDSSLKDLVNEPFAHLEPVTLDDDGEPKIAAASESEEEIPEPLRIFTEQAFEIKNILSEINALSGDSSDDDGDVNDQDDFHYEIDTFEVDEDDEESESIDEVVEETVKPEVVETKEDEPEIVEEPKVTIVEAVAEESKIVTEEVEPLTEIKEDAVEEEITVQETPIKTDSSALESDSSAFLENVKPIKKKKHWFVPVIILVLVGIVAALYFVYPPVNEFGNETYTTVKDNVSKWLTPENKNLDEIEAVVIPKDTTEIDSVAIEPVVDSLQILFDTPRVYPEFIASATITKGSRLAWLSKKYYGLSDFWVYIYEANRDRFEDPDKIPEGSLIHIPKLDPRLIDASNPRCVENAKKLHDLYVKR